MAIHQHVSELLTVPCEVEQTVDLCDVVRTLESHSSEWMWHAVDRLPSVQQEVVYRLRSEAVP